MRAKSVHESISFERGINPKQSLGIGDYNLIKKWLDEMRIKHYTINDDMSIDVNMEGVRLSHYSLELIPEFIKFNKISDFFSCHNNKLSSLRGCPEYVGGSFYCDSNKLESLEYSPKIVRGDFWCMDNKRSFSKKEVMKYCKVSGKIRV